MEYQVEGYTRQIRCKCSILLYRLRHLAVGKSRRYRRGRPIDSCRIQIRDCFVLVTLLRLTASNGRNVRGKIQHLVWRISASGKLCASGSLSSRVSLSNTVTLLRHWSCHTWQVIPVARCLIPRERRYQYHSKRSNAYWGSSEQADAINVRSLACLAPLKTTAEHTDYHATPIDSCSPFTLLTLGIPFPVSCRCLNSTQSVYQRIVHQLCVATMGPNTLRLLYIRKTSKTGVLLL